MVARSASRALGGKGNVALWLESEMGWHASQHVSLATPTLFTLPPCLLSLARSERHYNPCEPNFLQVLNIANILIVSSSAAKSWRLFLAGQQPTSCLCAINLFLFFEHPVPFGWISSLINFRHTPFRDEVRRRRFELFY